MCVYFLFLLFIFEGHHLGIIPVEFGLIPISGLEKEGI